MEIKYNVIQINCGDVGWEKLGLSRRLAIVTARQWAADGTGQVYICWRRLGDGTTGYLNRDGNHDFNGRAW